MLTNEESRVGTYPQIGTPTYPGAVTANTPLTDLDLNWTEKQLPQSQRTKHVHGLHPYLGKYIPQLVEVFLRRFFSAGQRVLDPFVGSGTTLVQANELSIRSVGYDVSAFNVLLSQVKTDNYDVVEVEREAKDVLQRTSAIVNRVNGQLSFWEQAAEGLEILPVDSQYLQDWFAPQALRELLTYRALLESGSYQYKNLLRIILARSARSARFLSKQPRWLMDCTAPAAACVSHTARKMRWSWFGVRRIPHPRWMKLPGIAPAYSATTTIFPNTPQEFRNTSSGVS